jgi:hypothetical protein
MEAADVVIMNDDLRRIPEVIRLSRRTHAGALAEHRAGPGDQGGRFLGLAVFGNATMWMAVFADMGASLLVCSTACVCCATGAPACGQGSAGCCALVPRTVLRRRATVTIIRRHAPLASHRHIAGFAPSIHMGGGCAVLRA